MQSKIFIWASLILSIGILFSVIAFRSRYTFSPFVVLCLRQQERSVEFFTNMEANVSPFGMLKYKSLILKNSLIIHHLEASGHFIPRGSYPKEFNDLIGARNLTTTKALICPNWVLFYGNNGNPIEIIHKKEIL